MLSLEKFKEAMGKDAKNYTDEELTEARDAMNKFADIAFDMWLEQKNKQIQN